MSRPSLSPQPLRKTDSRDALNEQQLRIVEAGKGAWLVDAGAGVGKTHTLVHRVAHLVAGGCDPRRILMVTFTRKAAQEMRDRVGRIVGRSVAWCSNFHSLCTRLLRQWPALGVPAGFRIADSDDSLRMMKAIIRELGADPKELTGEVRKQVEQARKAEFFGGSEYTFKAANMPFIAHVAACYEQRLIETNRLDFDGILYSTLRALRNHPEVLAQIAATWDYVMIDEGQDTDRVQFELMGMLAPHGNIMLVGDCDQSLYEFRGARPENLFDFQRDFHAKVLPLEINYRSNSEILRAANAIIKDNTSRLDKEVRSARGEGGTVTIRQHLTGASEATQIAIQLRKDIQEGDNPAEMAVLYRVGALSRSLEQALSSYGVPFRMVGGQRFWERAEVKDVLAYARVLLGSTDWDDWRRATRTPSIGVGDVAWEGVRTSETPERGLSLLATSNRKLATWLRCVRDARHGGAHAESLKELLNQSGFLTAIRGGSDQEAALQRFENAVEALRAIQDSESLQAFLDDVALGGSEPEEQGKPAVTLATVHKAKGLEWKKVHLVGLVEGVLPHRFASSPSGLEEERRCFYVACTRAKDELVLHHSDLVSLEASTTTGVPSRFLKNLPWVPRFRDGQGLQPQAGMGRPLLRKHA